MPFDAQLKTDPIEAAMQRAFRQIEAKAREVAQEASQDKAAAHCPLAEKIVANNQASELDGGMMGAMGVVLSSRDPRTAKRKAAETIIRLRRNRRECKRIGRNHHKADAELLRRARLFREAAIDFAEEMKRAGL